MARRLGFWAVLPLLGALLSVPLAPAEPAGWVEPDPADDVALAPNAPGVPVRHMPHVDLRSLAIEGEDERGLFFNATFTDFSLDDASAETTTVEVVVEFQVVGYHATVFLIGELESITGPTGAAVPAYRSEGRADACNVYTPNGRSCVSGAQRPFVQLFDDSNAVRLWISKQNIAMIIAGDSEEDEEKTGADGLPSMGVGVKLHQVSVRVVGGFQALFFTFSNTQWDTLPDEGPSTKPYTMQRAAAAYTLGLGIGGPFGNGGFYAPGSRLPLQLGIYVPPGPRRLLQLSYELEGRDAGAFAVAGPSNLSMTGGRYNRVTFEVETPATDARAELVVKAQAYPSGERGEARLMLAPGTPLGPNQSQLRFHRAPAEGPTCSTHACASSGILSVRETVPGFEAAGWMGSDYRPNDLYGFVLDLERPTTDPLAFLKGGRIELSLKIASSLQPRENVKVETAVLLGGFFGDEVMEESKDLSLTPEGAVFTFTGTVKKTHAILPSGMDLSVLVNFPDELFFVEVEEAPAFQLDVGGSSLKLPLGPVPTEFTIQPNPSPFQVHVLGDRSLFIQPGETRLYNVTILNQNATDQRLRLDTSTGPAGWSAEVRPGSEFLLGPGDSVTVGLLLRAPAGAVDGDVGRVRLNATAVSAAPAGIVVDATVATKVESPDEAEAFKADPDDEAKLVGRPESRTPAVSAIACLVVFGALGAIRRRRI